MAQHHGGIVRDERFYTQRASTSNPFGFVNRPYDDLQSVSFSFLDYARAGKAHQDLALNYGVDVTLGGAAKKEEN